MKKEVNLLPRMESLQLSYISLRMLSKLDLHFFYFSLLKNSLCNVYLKSHNRSKQQVCFPAHSGF